MVWQLKLLVRRVRGILLMWVQGSAVRPNQIVGDPDENGSRVWGDLWLDSRGYRLCGYLDS